MPKRSSAPPPLPRTSHPRPSRWPILLALHAAWLLAACLPPQASYELGLGTARVTGFMNVTADDPLSGGPLVVVYKNHHQYVNHPDGSAVLRPTAHVLRPGRQGGFSIDMPGDVVSMQVLFIAPGHLTQQFQFQRQIGMGNIHYRADLQAMADWRSHYYTYLSPQLEHLIVEPRYRLAPAEQRLLGDWLQAQNARLGAPVRGEAETPAVPRPGPAAGVRGG